MRNIILFDNETRDQLLPFTFTRPLCEIRIGILTIREKWERWLDGKVSYITQDYLSDKYDITISERNFLINGSVLPTAELCSLITQLENGEAMLLDGELIAAVLERDQFNRLMYDDIEELSSFEIRETQVLKINHIWDIFLLNDQAIRTDFDLLTRGRTSQALSPTNRVVGEGQIFVEPGARVECAMLNASAGPIYIGKNAEVMEGAMIRGSFALGERAVVKMGAKIYPGTTVGHHSTVGGELKNVVIFGNSNKGHEGYLGNSVIGEWCNLGADTNCSNLKNNWNEVKIWNYVAGDFLPSGQVKAGLFMGDFSMSGINSMFNTGTVIGLCCNIFGGDFPSKFVPSFSWGGGNHFATYLPDKAFEAVERMMSLHGHHLDHEDRLLLLQTFEQTSKYRGWDKQEEGNGKGLFRFYER